MSSALINSEIAEPYAQALMSVGQSQNLSEDFGDTFREVETLLEESSEFRDFITNPVIKSDDKKSVLKEVLGRSANAYLMNFLMLLVDKRRIVFLPAIIGQYLALLRKFNQTVLAEVTSTTNLNRDQTEAVISKVKSMTKAKNVEIKTTIDPDIIGGVIIKVGSQVIDASLRGQLRRLSLTLGNI
jgi:F-type H+-transporting ATPase subunit delta